MTRTLQEQVSDRLEIQQVLYRYAIAVDLRRWHLFDRVFTPDATIDGRGIGIKDVHDPRSFIDFVESSRGPDWIVGQHMMANIQYDIRDADADTFTECFTKTMLRADDPAKAREGTFALFYRDHLVRTDAGWLIEKRMLHLRGQGTHEVLITAPNIWDRALHSTPAFEPSAV